MDDSENVFSAKDVQKTAGLSYRQINDWDSRGALPHTREEKEGWRRFSPRDIFVLAVLNEIKTRLGIPLERLQFVRESMLTDDINYLYWAVQLMATLGVGVWLVTDLQESCILQSELDLQLFMDSGYFGGEEPAEWVLVKVNPIVNRLLATLKNPVHLPSHGKGYQILRELRQMLDVKNTAEQKLLVAIRTGDARKVEVTLDNGEIKTIRTTTHKRETEQLEKLLAEHDYQKLTVTMRDGRVVAIEQQATEQVPRNDPSVGIGEEAPPDAD